MSVMLMSRHHPRSRPGAQEPAACAKMRGRVWEGGSMRTLIEGGDIVACHDGGHRLLRGGALLIEDDRVAFVGRRHDGPGDRRVDAAGKLVIPGLVNTHCHATTEAGGRLI